MKKVILYWLTSCSVGYSQTPLNDPHWGSEMWIDNFNNNWNVIHDTLSNQYILTNSMGEGYWIVQNDYDKGGEPQVYKHENTTFTNEGLVFTAKRENYVCLPCSTGASYQNHKYTSGAISSWGDTALLYGRLIKYGYLEARIKMSDIYGMFPAFWTWAQIGTADYSVNPNTVTSGFDYDEIDIFEMVAGHESQYNKTILEDKYDMWNSYHIQMHDWANWILSTDLNYVNDYTSWHTYAIEWSPSQIIWYVDGQIVQTSYNIDNQLSQTASIILNLAMFNKGRSNFSPYDENSSTSYFEPPTSYGNQNSINDTDAEMVIDYIKYHRLTCSNDSVEYSTINALNSHVSEVKKTIIINGINLNTNSPKFLRASEAITLNDGFYSNGEEIYLDVNSCY